MPLSALLTTAYGQVLLIKLTLVALAAGLALTARLAATAASQAHIGELRRSLRTRRRSSWLAKLPQPAPAP